jgi:hypothetical protein
MKAVREYYSTIVLISQGGYECFKIPCVGNTEMRFYFLKHSIP